MATQCSKWSNRLWYALSLLVENCIRELAATLIQSSSVAGPAWLFIEPSHLIHLNQCPRDMSGNRFNRFLFSRLGIGEANDPSQRRQYILSGSFERSEPLASVIYESCL